MAEEKENLISRNFSTITFSIFIIWIVLLIASSLRYKSVIELTASGEHEIDNWTAGPFDVLQLRKIKF